MGSFRFEPAKAAVGLARFRAAPPVGRIVVASEPFQQGAMGALVRAELLAAARGLSVPIPVEGGGTGFVVGGARANAIQFMEPNPDVLPSNDESHDPKRAAATLYMAQQNAVRALVDDAKPSSLSPSIDLGGAAVEPVAFPVLAVAVTLAVVGAVALAVAGYAIGRASAADASAAAAAKAGNIDRMIELAQSGQPVSPDAWAAIAAAARAEASAPAIDWTTIAIVGAGVAGAWYVLREK